MPQLKVGDTIYHESRYWKTDDLRPDEVPGWNAEYVPYTVWKITPNMLWVYDSATATVTVSLPRRKRPQRRGHAPHQTLEADGKQYHSRFHEYFYVKIPVREPDIRRSAMLPKVARALSVLGLPQQPFTPEVVNRAYKQKAREVHPDTGGSHDDFIKLKDARDVALRGY